MRESPLRGSTYLRVSLLWLAPSWDGRLGGPVPQTPLGFIALGPPARGIRAAPRETPPVPYAVWHRHSARACPERSRTGWFPPEPYPP